MKIYNVGGSVRNRLMGLPPNDNDFVVVGSTPQEMLDTGYVLVGKDFPVFLKNGDEYALARKERSTGNGYHDFEVSFSPDITIEEDLFRRDFTMNAIAEDDEGNLIDPFGGQSDIKNRIIRVINPNSFVEDPVRILRLARFAAQFPSFRIDSETIELAKKGDISNAIPERVAKEMQKALLANKPSRFFDVLLQCHQLHNWFPEVEKLIGQIQPMKHHAEGDAYIHTMMVLDSSAKHNESLVVRFGCLVHDFGKGLTPSELLPKHHDHEKHGVQPTVDLCNRLKLSNELRRAGVLSAEFHMHVHKIQEMSDKKIVKVFKALKNDYKIVCAVSFHDVEGRLPYHANDNHIVFSNKMEKISMVKLSNLYTPEEISLMSVDKRKQDLHRAMLLAAK